MRGPAFFGLSAIVVAHKWILSGLAGLVLLGTLTYETVDRRAQRADLRQAEERLSLAVDTLSAAVARFVSIPSLVAESRLVADVLADPSNLARRDAANVFLEASARELGLPALYVLDGQGLALAASNWREATSFVGHDYSFRPYFLDAMRRGSARYYGVGVTTGQPGFFLSAAVRGGAVAAPVGVVVAKVDFAPLEASWASGGETIFVSDEDGIIILTTKAAARYHALQALPPERLARLAQEQRYADQRFGDVLPAADRVADALQASPVPGTAWRLTVQTASSGRRWQAGAAALIAMLLPLVSGLSYVSWRQRRARLQAERRARAELEDRVAARTADLKDTLNHLEREVEERQKIEGELHETRNELVVAAKLAALGRALSGLAHEVNQPLAALRTHLHCARLLIERDDSRAAIDNIVVMLEAVDRLAALTGDFKQLAFRRNDERRAVDLCDIVRRVAGLLRFRFADAGVVFEASLGAPAMVLGSAGRLEQVVLNLLLNAMDAVADEPRREVRAEVTARADCVELVVVDTGPGVSEADRTHLFEPFFTTKPEGEGLGLGLAVSHAIVKDHGGSLTYLWAPQHGSRFVVTLPAHIAEG